MHDVAALVRRAFAEDLAHLEAMIAATPTGVAAVVRVTAPDAETARWYLEDRIGAALSNRALVLEVEVDDIAVDEDPARPDG